MKKKKKKEKEEGGHDRKEKKKNEAFLPLGVAELPPRAKTLEPWGGSCNVQDII
jgi:hypothetical protein